MKIRKIIHIDMDAFYASVEQRDNPSLSGKPVIVGGSPSQRGVVSTCSYEARKFGVHSAMATALALKKCPQAILIYPDFSKYREASETIHSIFAKYSRLIEPLSLDEAYLDVTDNIMNISSATKTAELIKSDIYRATKLHSSAGVSYNKFLAKIASDYNKPDGLCVIKPKDAEIFLKSLKIGKFYGVGKVSEQRFKDMGIYYGSDLVKLSLTQLNNIFGRSGTFLYYAARGIDERPVTPFRERKSIGKELTLQQDTLSVELIKKILYEQCKEVAVYLKKKNLKAKTVSLKIKYHDFKSISRSVTLNKETSDPDEIFRYITHLLTKTEAGKRKVRLTGLSLSNLTVPERLLF